jgi:hypothetical protein
MPYLILLTKKWFAMVTVSIVYANTKKWLVEDANYQYFWGKNLSPSHGWLIAIPLTIDELGFFLYKLSIFFNWNKKMCWIVFHIKQKFSFFPQDSPPPPPSPPPSLPPPLPHTRLPFGGQFHDKQLLSEWCNMRLN